MKKLFAINFLVFVSFFALRGMEINEKEYNKNQNFIETNEIKTNENLSLKNQNRYTKFLSKINPTFLPSLAEIIIGKLLLTFLVMTEETSTHFKLNNPAQYTVFFDQIKTTTDLHFATLESDINALNFLNYFDKMCEKAAEFNYTFIKLYINEREKITNLINDVMLQIFNIKKQLALQATLKKSLPLNEKKKQLKETLDTVFTKNDLIHYVNKQNITEATYKLHDDLVELKNYIEKNSKDDLVDNYNKASSTYNEVIKKSLDWEKLNTWLSTIEKSFLKDESSHKLFNEFALVFDALLKKINNENDVSYPKIKKFKNFVNALQKLLKNRSITELTEIINIMDKSAKSISTSLHAPKTKTFNEKIIEKNVVEKKLKKTPMLLSQLKSPLQTLGTLPLLLQFLKQSCGLVTISTPKGSFLDVTKTVPLLEFLMHEQIILPKTLETETSIIAKKWILLSPLYDKFYTIICDRIKKLEKKNSSRINLLKKNGITPSSSNNKDTVENIEIEEKIEKVNEGKTSPSPSNNLNKSQNSSSDIEPKLYTKQELHKMIEFSSTHFVETDTFLILFRSWCSDSHGQAMIIIRKPKKACTCIGALSYDSTQSSCKKDMFHKVIKSLITNPQLLKYGRSFVYDSTNTPDNIMKKYNIKKKKLQPQDLVIYFPGFMFTGSNAKNHFLELKKISLCENNDTAISNYIHNINTQEKHVGAGVCIIRNNAHIPVLIHNCFHKKS